MRELFTLNAQVRHLMLLKACKCFLEILDCWKITIVLKDRYQEQNKLAPQGCILLLVCGPDLSGALPVLGKVLLSRGSLIQFRGSTMVNTQSLEKKIRKEN